MNNNSTPRARPITVFRGKEYLLAQAYGLS